MNSQVQVLLSNQTEALYQSLKEQLFSSDTDPFTKRVVIVPSKAMKSWLSIRLAEDLGIATGITFLFLEPAIKQIEKSLSANKEQLFQLPSKFELSLKIESEVRRTLNDPSNSVWDRLRKHLCHRKSGKITHKGEKRLVILAEQLAGLFQLYDKYGRKMLKRWLQSSSKDWQEELWCKVVGKLGPDHLEWKSGNTVVHLFALSYLSRIHHTLFCDLARQIPVYYYLLSPCEVYWSDLLSDKENQKLISVWEKQGMSSESLTEATELLFERNPLLANWGKLGRLMAAQIEDSPLQTKEDYREHKQESCCLHALQMDLLKLRHGKYLPTREFKEDSSVQIHVSLSKTREVQALYQTLLGILGREDAINPNDIVVMVPNIKAYEPMIRAVFRSPKSQIDCQIMDLNLLDHNDVIKGFLHLVTLPDTRWENETLLNLFSFRFFQEKQGLKPSQVEKIGKWIKDTGIRWGIDPKHRSELLLRSHCEKGMADKSAAGTWKMGVDRLLLGTAMILPSDVEEKASYTHRPLKEVNSTDQEILGIWSGLLNSLREDLKPISEGSKKTLKDWADYLLNLLYRYFSWNSGSEDEKAQATVFVRCLENLKKSGVGKGDLFPFSTVIFHLKKGLEKEEVHYRETHFQSVKFCSMLPMRAVPAKVVVMMGLSEDNYPRKEERLLLNQLYHQEGVDPFPSATEFDRYLFLEALMSAREYLILSYHKNDQGKDPLHQCSLLISELVHYLDQSFEISGSKPSVHCVYEHPFSPFDYRYFQKESKIESYSMGDYQAAISFYGSQQKAPYRFIPSFSVGSNFCRDTRCVDIQDIKRLARNPIRFYFQKKLGMYLKEEEEVLTDESLTVSSLDLSKFRKESCVVSLETLLKGAELEGMVPVGPFKDLSLAKVVKEVAEIAEQMLEFSIRSEDLFEVLLCETCTTPYLEEKRWIFPPLVIELENLKVSLTGLLGECSPEGLISYKKGEGKNLAEIWPLYLIWNCLLEKDPLPFKKDALFIRGGVRWTPFFDSAMTHLQEYMQYFLCSTDEVSPLIPDWVEAFVSGSTEDLNKAVQKSVSGDFFFNDEVIWLCREGNVLQPELMYENWSEQAKKLFKKPFEHLTGKKK